MVLYSVLILGCWMIIYFLVGMYASVHHAPVLADTEGEIPLQGKETEEK